MGEDESGGDPPCWQHLTEPDEVQRRDVARWRRAERARLIAARLALPAAARQAAAEDIARRLEPLAAGAGAVALYWPFRGEPDLRGWAERCRAAGRAVLLPVVVQRAAPLVFRLWTPGMTLERGVWGIPVPPAQAPRMRPDLVIAPVVGLDEENYRLGHGGGYYDRTLASLRRAGQPVTAVGVGYALQRIATIFPQPHDVAMDAAVLAEAG